MKVMAVKINGAVLKVSVRDRNYRQYQKEKARLRKLWWRNFWSRLFLGGIKWSKEHKAPAGTLVVKQPAKQAAA